MLSLTHLKTFLTAVRFRSFTRAAVELALTQPAVSAHIALLEQEFGCALFNRTGRRVVLTDAGRALEKGAKEIFERIETVRSEIDDLGRMKGGTISIGASRIVGVYMLPHILMRFRDLYPDIEMKISIHSAHTIKLQVEDNAFDLGIVGEGGPIDSENVGVTPIGEDHLVIVVPPKHPFAQRESLTIADIRNETFIMSGRLTASQQSLKAQLAAIGLHFKSPLTIDDAGAIKRAVLQGAGLAILSRAVVEQEVIEGKLAALELSDYPLRRKILLLWRKDRRFSRNAETFMRFVREAFSESQSSINKNS